MHYSSVRSIVTSLPLTKTESVDWKSESIAFAELGEPSPRAELLSTLQRAKLFDGVTPISGSRRLRVGIFRRLIRPSDRTGVAEDINQQYADAFDAVIEAAKPRPYVLISMTSAGSTIVYQPSFLDFLFIPALIVPTDLVTGVGRAEFWIVNTATGTAAVTGSLEVKLVGHTPPAFEDLALQIQLNAVARKLDDAVVDKLCQVCR